MQNSTETLKNIGEYVLGIYVGKIFVILTVIIFTVFMFCYNLERLTCRNKSNSTPEASPPTEEHTSELSPAEGADTEVSNNIA